MNCEFTGGCKEPKYPESCYCKNHAIDYHCDNLADWEAGKIPKDVWEKFGGHLFVGKYIVTEY